MGVSQEEISDFLTQWSDNNQGTLLIRIMGVVILLLIAHWLIRFVTRRLDRLMERSGLDPTIRQFFSRLFSASLFGLLIIIILSILGVPMTAVIAVMAAAALAVGLALRDNSIQVRYHVIEQVKVRIDEAGISIPYPQRDVHLINMELSENGRS